MYSPSCNDNGCVTDQEAGEVTSEVAVVKALITSCDILLEELQKFSKAVGQAIDFSESKMSNPTFLTSILQAKHLGADVEITGVGKPQNGPEVLNLFHSAYYFLYSKAMYTIYNDSFLI